jgi:hypothetical protein
MTSRGGARTRTSCYGHRILSPVRLPVSPLGHFEPRIVAWKARHCKTASCREILILGKLTVNLTKRHQKGDDVESECSEFYETQ